MANRLAREVAEASRVKDPSAAKFVSARHADVLVQCAKRLQRLQTKRARLRKDLKACEADIRTEKRNLKALAAQIGRGEL